MENQEQSKEEAHHFHTNEKKNTENYGPIKWLRKKKIKDDIEKEV
jgi:hypothetical protein